MNKTKLFLAISCLALLACGDSSSSDNATAPSTEKADILDSSSSEGGILSSSESEEPTSSSLQEPASSAAEEPESSAAEESSSSSEEDISSSAVEESSSSAVEEVLSSANDENLSSAAEDVSSSSEEAPSSSEDAEEVLSQECEELRSTFDKFHDVTDVLKCVRKSEKVAFVLRHAARDKSKDASTDLLNDDGRAQSIALGKQLKDVEDIYFMYTDVYRNMETVLKIAEGKGQNFSETEVPFKEKSAADQELNNDLKDAYLIKDQNKFSSCKEALKNQFNWQWSWSSFTYMAYEENVIEVCQEAFYDIDDRIQDFIDTYFTYEKMHNITIAISHDKVMTPMAIAASKRQIDLRFHEHDRKDDLYNYWINYLSGISIIINKDDKALLLPTTGVGDGFLREYPEK